MVPCEMVQIVQVFPSTCKENPQKSTFKVLYPNEVE